MARRHKPAKPERPPAEPVKKRRLKPPVDNGMASRLHERYGGVANLGYTPRPAFVPMHQRKQRWGCIVAHRRAGKTVSCVMDLIDAALRCPRAQPRFGYVAPYYTQAKDIAWSYVKDYGLRVPGATVNESELRLDLPNGGRVRLYGAENYDRMRGIYLDGVVMDEPADMSPVVWPEVIRPTLSDRGGWALFIGTPKGRNEFFNIWQQAQADPDRWFSMMLKASQSGIVSDDELRDAQAIMTPEQYAQEYECSFDAAIVGAYYAQDVAEAEADGRIGDFPPDPNYPVHTAWDLGVSDSTAIWLWQAVPGGIRVLDYIEGHGKSIVYYVAELRARGHNYGIDFLPHDARARSLETGRSIVETLEKKGRDVRLVPNHRILDGINNVRMVFPRLHFDRQCAIGLEALRQYRTEYDERRKVFRETPLHDWSSHAADAMRYLAISYTDLHQTRPPKALKPNPGQVILPGAPEPRDNTRIKL